MQIHSEFILGEESENESFVCDFGFVCNFCLFAFGIRNLLFLFEG